MLDTSKVYNSNKHGQFKVLNYFNYKSVEIEFLDTGYKTKTQVGEIRKGCIKDLLSPNVFGVGFIGDGDHKPSVNSNTSPAYIVWKSMLKRCYSTNFHIKQPTYIGCTVTPLWHNFQNFAKWFDENYIEGFQIDKDCKIEGNKVYSPENCMFVSRKENMVKARAKHYIFTAPGGETVSIYNLAEFCRDKGLSAGVMSKVVNGKANHHKQWTCDHELTSMFQ